jgi:hypothetical protein
VRPLDNWMTAVVTEGARTVRHALGSWGRTARLCVLASTFATIIGILLTLRI